MRMKFRAITKCNQSVGVDSATTLADTAPAALNHMYILMLQNKHGYYEQFPLHQFGIEIQMNI